MDVSAFEVLSVSCFHMRDIQYVTKMEVYTLVFLSANAQDPLMHT